jgi:hypothetical protein
VEAVHGLVVVDGQALQEALGQGRDVLLALAQGGDVDGEDVQAVVEVGAERAAVAQVLEVHVGGGDDPRLHGNVLLPAHPVEDAVLEHLEELDLHRRGHGADLVQEDGAVGGQLELAELAAHRAGEGPLLVAEELALQQVLGDGPAVHADEGAVPAVGVGVDEPGQHALAGAGLALEQDRGTWWGPP